VLQHPVHNKTEFGGHWVCLEDGALDPLTLLNGYVAGRHKTVRASVVDASSAKIRPPFLRLKKLEKCRLFVRSYEVQDQREPGNGKFDGSR
jgi:hypothetical protein